MQLIACSTTAFAEQVFQHWLIIIGQIVECYRLMNVRMCEYRTEVNCFSNSTAFSELSVSFVCSAVPKLKIRIKNTS